MTGKQTYMVGLGGEGRGEGRKGEIELLWVGLGWWCEGGEDVG